MQEITVSEHQEGALVTVGAILDSIAAFVAAAPIPLEWKAPTAALTAGVGTAILAYWYKKVNRTVE